MNKTHSSLPTRRTIFLSLVCGMLIVFVTDSNLAARPTEQPSSTEQPHVQSVPVTETLQASFGSSVEAVIAFKPFYLTGDFNGDGMQDIVIVVRIKERRDALAKDVRLMNPFYSSPKITFPQNPAAENKLALAIIHSWKTPDTAAKFLLIGEAPVLVFAYDRTSDANGSKNLLELMSKRGKRRRGQTFPPRAKGDVILLGTEVGSDSPLYWDGKTYRWEEPEGD